MMRRGKTVAVVGEGAVAGQMVAAIGALAGVAQVRQVAVEEFSNPQRYDVVVEAVGGVAGAYKVAMGALSQGVDCVVSSPFLLAAHGEVLAAAGRGQGARLGVCAAGFGVPVVPLVQAVAAWRVVFGLGGGNILFNRMRARQESMAQAERQLELQQADLSDRAGKVTLARAVALAGAWQSVWHGSKAAAVQRGSVDGVDVGLMRQLRGLGLELVMAAQVDAAAVYAGPLAVPVGSALADGLLAGENVLVAEHATGEAVVRLVADEVALGVAGVVADMREIVRGVWAEVVGGAVAAGEDVEMQQVVFCGYSKRGAVLDAVEQVVYEKVATDGQWQAVVRGADFASLRMRLPEAVIVPMAGGWEVPAGGLRLVG